MHADTYHGGINCLWNAGLAFGPPTALLRLLLLAEEATEVEADATGLSGGVFVVFTASIPFV